MCIFFISGRVRLVALLLGHQRGRGVRRENGDRKTGCTICPFHRLRSLVGLTVLLKRWARNNDVVKRSSLISSSDVYSRRNRCLPHGKLRFCSTGCFRLNPNVKYEVSRHTFPLERSQGYGYSHHALPVKTQENTTTKKTAHPPQNSNKWPQLCGSA